VAKADRDALGEGVNDRRGYSRIGGIEAEINWHKTGDHRPCQRSFN
jgi:hypothetical protein